MTVSYLHSGHTSHGGIGNYRWRWFAVFMGWWKTLGLHKPKRIFILDRVPAPRFVARLRAMRELGRPYEEWECTKCETTKTWDLSAP